MNQFTNNSDIKFNQSFQPNQINHDNYSNYDDRSEFKIMASIVWFLNYYLPIITPLLGILLFNKNNKNDLFVKECKKVINFTISYFIYIGVFTILSFVIIGIPFLFIASFWFVLAPLINIILLLINGRSIRDVTIIKFIK